MKPFARRFPRVDDAQALGRLLDSVADEMGDEIHFVEIDIAASPDIAQNAGITGTPTVQVVVVVVDSHIQRIVLATEETTVTQQVSHRPIKRQSRLWSQRGTKVNGSHHGDNPLLRPTGIQIATKSYAALQAMAPTNIKTVHQTSLLHSRATSIDSECCRLPTTSVLSNEKCLVVSSFKRGVQKGVFLFLYLFSYFCSHIFLPYLVS